MRFELGTRQLDRKYTAGKTVVRSTSTTRQRKTLNIKSTEQQGREAWAELHSYVGNDPEWFAKWLRRIPSIGCSCRKDFTKILADYPPDYTDSDSFWRWGWFIHNLVNEKLGKPVLSLDEAKQQWITPKEQ